MNPLMAFVVDSMRRSKDLYGLKKLLKEAIFSKEKFWSRKKKVYMNQVIQIIKKEINEIESEKK